MDQTHFESQRSELITNGMLGPAFGRAYAALVDNWLQDLLGDESRVALIAAGGYGRRELTPNSDLDLVLVHDRRRDIGVVAERLWYPIWNSGVALDHSVRTPREVVAVCDDDLKSVLSLLDGRVVAGDKALGEQVLGTVRHRWARSGRRRLGPLDAITRSRHEKEGDVAHLLEPDLKNGKGGLRDVALFGALAAAAPFVVVDPALDDARSTLLTVRIELHRATRRTVDCLRLEDQDAVAARLGLRDADALMADVASAGRTVARCSDEAWTRIRLWLSRSGRRRRSHPKPIGRGILVLDDEIYLADDANTSDRSLLIRVAEQAARLGLPIHGSALRHLVESAPTLRDRWSDESRDALIGLLGAGDNLVAIMETLDQYGLMTRILPEWENVRSLPQRNAFHRFCVDRHLTETAARAAAWVREVSRPDLLLVGAWLHDLGKGFPGDHTAAGVRLMNDIAARMGFDPPDVETLVSLVQHHLLLPSVATSRDLDDPRTIVSVATAVVDPERLHLLAVLTKADSLATGPAAWSSWKEELVDELVERVERALLGERQPETTRDAWKAVTADLVERANGRLLAEGSDRRLVIVAPDRPGLLCAVVGLLTVHGCNIHSGRLFTDEHGNAVEEIVFEPAFEGRSVDWPRFRAELKATLAGELPLAQRVERRARANERRPSAARPAEPRVVVHAGASETSIVLEVRAADDIGLLYRITRTISDLGFDIHQARASTLGHEVVDTFYIRNPGGIRPTEAETEALRQALLAALRSAWSLPWP